MDLTRPHQLGISPVGKFRPPGKKVLLSISHPKHPSKSRRDDSRVSREKPPTPRQPFGSIRMKVGKAPEPRHGRGLRSHRRSGENPSAGRRWGSPAAIAGPGSSPLPGRFPARVRRGVAGNGRSICVTGQRSHRLPIRCIIKLQLERKQAKAIY